jgi:undecaprenyl-diphosphatase
MRKQTKETIAVIGVAFLALIILSVFVHYYPVLRLDVSISRDLQSEGSTALNKGFIYWTLVLVSSMGNVIPSAVIVLGLSALFWLYKYKKEAVFILLAPLSVVLNSILKLIINRPRPTSSLVNVVFPEANSSFPSSHTVLFGFLILATFNAKKFPLWLRVVIGLFSAAMIILVSFSRIYLGAHWASDVVGGYIFGGILLLILIQIYERVGGPQ